MAVPYTFGTATASIPLSNLDSNFATTITLGNTAIQLGNTVTTLNNMTLANATVSSLSTAITVAQGGTGLTSTPANGALDIGNGTGFTRTTLTAGSGISITNGAGSISIAASGGTATSIANGTSNVSIATSGGNVVVATNGNTAVTVDTSQNATFVGYINAPNTFGFKNRIINGAMVIDQRNAGASVTPTSSGYVSLDRWQAIVTQTSKFSLQQNAGSVTPPDGFKNYLGVTSLSAYSVAAGDAFAIAQKIEGYNIADLSWGTANAKTITISAWVRSSLTGTFGGALQNSDGTRNYPFSYSIPVANTWTQISITIAGDTTGTWNATNSSGIGINFGLGAGSTYSGTAGAWTATNAYSATGAVSVVGTNGATFYITGVQLEKGSTATSFDYRPYMIEEQLCMRYYEKTIDGANGMVYGITSIVGNQRGTYPFKVRKRATPTVAYTTVQTSVLTVSVDWVAIQRTNDNAEMIGGNYSAEL